MKLDKHFDLDRPRAIVWSAFSDVRLVAECLPGASIIEDLGGDKYKGRFAIKLGPMAASFDGDVAITRDTAAWTAIVAGKGADARSSSRANGSMTYVLTEPSAGKTHVAVTSEINLAGALAQFGKGAIVQEVANRITAEFVNNFEARLASDAEPSRADASAPSSTIANSAAQPAAQSSQATQLDAGNLLWSIIRDRIAGFFRGLSRK